MSDVISRQVAISAICSACGKIDCDKMDKCEKLQLPPANCSEFPNSSDTISRQQAIEALVAETIYTEEELREYYEANSHRNEWVNGIYEAIEAIKQLPSAQPEPLQPWEVLAAQAVLSQPEIIYCKDCKKQNRHYHESPYKDTVCPLTAWRGTAQGHEYDYQFCCFAERREVTT